VKPKGHTKIFATIQGGFATVTGVIRPLRYHKWFYRNAFDATSHPTRGSRRRENTTFIERVFLALLSSLMSFTAIGSSGSKSTTEVCCACWWDRDIFLAHSRSEVG